MSEFRSVRGCFEQYTKDADERLRELAALRGALESEALGRCHGLLFNAFDFIERQVLPALERAERSEAEQAGMRQLLDELSGRIADAERENLKLYRLLEGERERSAKLREACKRARCHLANSAPLGLTGHPLPEGLADDALRAALEETEAGDA